MRHNGACERRSMASGNQASDSAIGLVLSYWQLHLAGCRSAVAADPAAIFQNIRSDFLHGNLDAAQQKAEKARKDFSAGSADWAMKFRLLEAEILTYQGRRPEVIALLNSPGVSYPADGRSCDQEESALRVGARQARPGAASGYGVAGGAALVRRKPLPLSGEVLRTEAVVQIYRDHLDRGRGPVQKKPEGRP